jgi:hypothetical protein
MDYKFYVDSKSVDLVTSSRTKKLLLIGSFTGCWNFGDMMQMQSIVQLYTARCPSYAIIPLVNAVSIASDQDAVRIASIFDTPAIVFYSRASANPPSLNLQKLISINNVEALHLYGGGMLNSFWGDTWLRLLDSVLSWANPRLYLVSGQQVEAGFGSLIAAHFNTYGPCGVGCRDEESVRILRRQGVPAQYSGDDGLGSLLRLSMSQGSPTKIFSLPQCFAALQIALPQHTYMRSSAQEDDLIMERVALEAVNEAITSIAKFYNAPSPAMIVNAYRDARDLHDTLSTLRKTRFSEYFPVALAVDLPGLIMSRQIERIKDIFITCRPTVSINTYYHPTLMAMVLGIPAYLLVINSYYRQKALGLGQKAETVHEFLQADPYRVKATQESFLRRMTDAHLSWSERVLRTIAQ